MTVRRILLGALITLAAVIAALGALCTFASWRLAHLRRRVRWESIDMTEANL